MNSASPPRSGPTVPSYPLYLLLHPAHAAALRARPAPVPAASRLAPRPPARPPARPDPRAVPARSGLQ